MATWQLISIKKLLVASFLLFAVYLVSMLGATKAYLFGAQSYSEYIYAISAPFFAGFVLIGFFGLLKVYKDSASKECLYGFLVVGFCYGGIEVMLKTIGVS